MTEAEIKSKIQQIIEFPQHFIMAHGGEGMQSLSYHISQYSPRYELIQSERTSETNEYYNHFPFFYKVLRGLISDGGNVDQLIDQMYKLLVLHSPTNSIENTINEALFYHSQKSKLPLFSSHFSNNDYFTTTNTWFMHLDEYRWFEYKWMLWFSKVWPSSIRPNRFENVINARKTYFYLKDSPKVALFDTLLEKLWQTGATSVQQGYIAYIEFSPDSFTELPQDYLSIPLSELISHCRPRIPEFFSARMAFLESINTLNKVNIINYSQIFDLGYVENMFEITNPEFHSHWVNWHTSNLAVLEARGYSTENYQIQG
jgi:hypothetical protein